MSIFAVLDTYHEDASHSAALNLAIDEALLEAVEIPSIRFYRWHTPALSFGYFGRFAEVVNYARERDLVRRCTGGGIVFHGEDLTYSIVIPVNHQAFAESSISMYEKIHRALCDAFNAIGERAVVAGGVAPGRIAVGMRAAVDSSRYNCFSNPVRADVMLNGRKIAGAAQRRTRMGLLHQGSIQGVDPGSALAERFAKKLSSNCHMWDLPSAIHFRAQEIVARKYGTETWLRKR